ncbi:MAG: hypothetical protein P4L31_00820 [Candidatus Babeliales bacterium]|nr:hypothetical protein [Candidatus Babeliales bacterium]
METENKYLIIIPVILLCIGGCFWIKNANLRNHYESEYCHNYLNLNSDRPDPALERYEKRLNDMVQSGRYTEKEFNYFIEKRDSRYEERERRETQIKNELKKIESDMQHDGYNARERDQIKNKGIDRYLHLNASLNKDRSNK